MMTESHDVQSLSDVDIHVYEAVASQTVEHGSAELDALVRATDLDEDDVRESLATLIEHGHVVPKGEGYALGRHTFEVEY
ncbi:hypothetical protein E1267_11425 [Nonomuraea longispora]|uniref:MarR family transcriptional regulator n=1 Tax=Nonomuraea longispora TaxID=1848320 RepID=A0A4R4NHR4_9ACTN|nr:hypothetical protein [Nonomuraea longispora]TDC08074.1 hypothetical protein E1267_11425 [Nonomuraea longispora]